MTDYVETGSYHAILTAGGRLVAETTAGGDYATRIAADRDRRAPSDAPHTVTTERQTPAPMAE